MFACNRYNTEEPIQSSFFFFFKVPELFPEPPWNIVLQSWCGQMSKNDLQMPQHPDVVFFPVFWLTGGFIIKLMVVAEYFIPRIHITLRSQNLQIKQHWHMQKFWHCVIRTSSAKVQQMYCGGIILLVPNSDVYNGWKEFQMFLTPRTKS